MRLPPAHSGGQFEKEKNDFYFLCFPCAEAHYNLPPPPSLPSSFFGSQNNSLEEGHMLASVATVKMNTGSVCLHHMTHSDRARTGTGPSIAGPLFSIFAVSRKETEKAQANTVQRILWLGSCVPPSPTSNQASASLG